VNKKGYPQNLKPFKKGEVHNPRGGGAHDPLTKAIRKVTKASFKKMLHLAMTSNPIKLEELSKSNKITALDRAIATSFYNAMKNGDYGVIERIAERIVGKIPDEININHTIQIKAQIDINKKVLALSDGEVVERLKRIRSSV
jgi:hypothetical protein